MTGRLTVVSALVTLAALAAAGLILSASFRDYATRDVDERLLAVLDDMIGASEIGPDGILRFNRPLYDQRFSQQYSGWYWEVLEEGAPPFRSRSMWDFELILDLGPIVEDVTFHEHEGPDEQILRVAEREIRLPEAPDRPLHYIAAADTREVQAAIERFDGLLARSLGLITLAVAVALMAQVLIALKPLRRIRRHLVDVRSGGRARMASDYPEDIQPLADEIDALIDHNGTLLARARTHVGNLAHGIKTPLSVIQNELVCIEKENGSGPRLDRISRQVSGMAKQIDHHVRRARVAGGGAGRGVNVADRLGKMSRVVERLYRDKALSIQHHIPDQLVFAGEQQDFDEIAGNLIENAGKWAKSVVKVEARLMSVRGARPMLELRVDDDGPGVPAEERATLFERGKRLDETVPGTGLGLAIVADIVELYGGHAMLDESPLGGLKATVTLPVKSF